LSQQPFIECFAAAAAGAAGEEASFC